VYRGRKKLPPKAQIRGGGKKGKMVLGAVGSERELVDQALLRDRFEIKGWGLGIIVWAVLEAK